MKYSGLYLLIYNAICLLVLKTDWYSELVTMYSPFKGIVTAPRYAFINVYDIPFYIIGYSYMLYNIKKMALMQIVFFVFSFLFVALCWINDKYHLLGMKDFLFYGWLIIFLPLSIFIGNNFKLKKYK